MRGRGEGPSGHRRQERGGAVRLQSGAPKHRSTPNSGRWLLPRRLREAAATLAGEAPESRVHYLYPGHRHGISFHSGVYHHQPSVSKRRPPSPRWAGERPPRSCRRPQHSEALLSLTMSGRALAVRPITFQRPDWRRRREAQADHRLLLRSRPNAQVVGGLVSIRTQFAAHAFAASTGRT